MFTDFWTQLASTNRLTSSELRIIAALLKQLDFQSWIRFDHKEIAEELNLDTAKVAEAVQKLIIYQIIEREQNSLCQGCYRYRLKINLGGRKTVDLVFSDGIDWQAFLTSFQKLQTIYSNWDLAIQAIENKSGGILVVRIEVPYLGEPAEIEKYFTQEYDIQLQTLEEKYRLQLQDKEIEINQQNSANILKIVELMAKVGNSIQNIEDIKTIAESKSILENHQVKYGLSYDDASNNLDTAKTESYQQITKTNYTKKPKQTLAEAVAEKEKNKQKQRLSKHLEQTEPNSKETDNLAEADNTAYVDAQITLNCRLKKADIKTRLKKHCN